MELKAVKEVDAILAGLYSSCFGFVACLAIVWVN